MYVYTGRGEIRESLGLQEEGLREGESIFDIDSLI